MVDSALHKLEDGLRAVHHDIETASILEITFLMVDSWIKFLISSLPLEIVGSLSRLLMNSNEVGILALYPYGANKVGEVHIIHII